MRSTSGSSAPKCSRQTRPARSAVVSGPTGESNVCTRITSLFDHDGGAGATAILGARFDVVAADDERPVERAVGGGPADRGAVDQPRQRRAMWNHRTEWERLELESQRRVDAVDGTGWRIGNRQRRDAARRLWRGWRNAGR